MANIVATGPRPSTRQQRKSARKSSHWIEDLLARSFIGGEIREHIPSLEGESASTSSHWIEDLQANPSMATKASKQALITLERKSASTSCHWRGKLRAHSLTGEIICEHIHLLGRESANMRAHTLIGRICEHILLLKGDSASMSSHLRKNL
jgi:hypothetical protein